MHYVNKTIITRPSSILNHIIVVKCVLSDLLFISYATVVLRAVTLVEVCEVCNK